MNLPAVARARPLPVASVDLGRLAAWTLPFVLVTYLGLRGGGYDTVVRGQVGIAVWWILLLGGVAGVLPLARIGRRGWIGFALLAAFAAWTTLAVAWSDSPERSLVEAGRVGAYLGILGLAVAALARRRGRDAMNGAAAGVAAIALLAVLSRLHPSWFPANDAARVLGQDGTRLNYPLNYWNGLAALMALGAPLLLAAAASARTLAGRAAAAAALPVVGLCAWLTFSRGGALALGVALAVLLALVPNRLTQALTLALGGGGAAIAIVSIAHRDAIQYGHHSALAATQARQMTAVLLVTCAGVALLQVAAALLGRRVEQPRALRQVRRGTAYLIGTLLAGAVLGVAVSGVPHSVSSRWEDFKKPKLVLSGGQKRFQSASGRGRYQYWQSASQAEGTRPLTGRGPGTFELWWARHGTLPGFVRDAHSLYMETYGELGLPGLILLVAFLGYVLAVGVARSLLRGRGRFPIAACTAGCAAFCVSASLDWVWELGVLPAAFMVLAAVILVSGERGRRRRWEGRRRTAARAGAVAVAVAALVAVGLPLLTASDLSESRDRASAGDLAGALRASLAAQETQPGASAPRLQRALLLEAAGALDPAASAAREATARGPRDWRNWLIRSRIDAERGAAAASVDAYRRARSLNPRGRIFSSQ